MQWTKERTEIMKKILAVILSLAMVLCMMPSIAFAAGTPTVNIEVVTPDGIDYFPWTGSGITPELKVTVTPADGGDSVTLTSNEYKAIFTDNVQPGKASVAVTVTKEEYKDAVGEADFKIKKALSAVSLQTPATVTDGTIISVDNIKLTDNGNELTPGTDYTLKSGTTTTINKDNKVVTIEATADSNYYGEREITFSIGESIKNATVTVPNLTYTGKEQTAVPTVTLGYKTLRKDIDYRVTGDKATDRGTYTLTITGIGAYAEFIKKDYVVNPKNLANVSVPYIDNQVVDATPEPVITDGTKTLVLGTDYTLSYANNDQVGKTAVLTISGIGNYTGTVTRNYLIKDSISDAVVSYTKTFYDYTGSPVYPQISVKSTDPKKTYVLNRDYKIVGGGEINEGYYSFSLVGIGNYGGEFFKNTYTINKLSLATAGTAVLSGDMFTYTGKAVEPYVTVTCGGRTLRKDVDYSVTYSNNNRIGTASVIIYGKGNYTGSITKTFRIVGKDLSQVSGTLSQTSYNYDGLEKKPTVTLYDGTKKLTSGVDYTVSYRNNKNAGTGEVIVTGKGNYGGTKTLTFRIIGKSQTVTTRYTRYTKTLKSAPFNLQAGHDGDGTLVYKTSDPSVATVSATGTVTITGTGKAIITVSTTGNVKYDPASKAVYVNVKPLKPVIKVTSPAKKQIKVMITKVKGATKYQVKYGANGVYHNKYIVHNENSYAKVYTKIKNRVSGKTYEVKVRAYKTMADGTKVWGDWTTVKKIKAK